MTTLSPCSDVFCFFFSITTPEMDKTRQKPNRNNHNGSKLELLEIVQNEPMNIHE